MNRILAAFFHSMRGMRAAFAGESAIRQEVILLAAGLILTPFIASGLWQAVAMIGALLFILAVELLNTAIENLSDHVTPERHETIGYVKDLGSAAVFCALLLAGIVWLAALYERVFG